MKRVLRCHDPVLKLRSWSQAAQRRHTSLRRPRILAFVLRHSHFDIPMLTVCVASLLTSGGCRRNEPAFEVLSLQGKIEKLDVNSDETGEITLLYYSEKQGRDIIGAGLVTRETEIMINGAIAKLSDLREGDRVRGEVRLERKRGEKIQTALKIYVDRPEPTGDD